MSINQHNYEAFYLDYIEGNLSAEIVAELILFLEENPAIKEELDDFDLIELNDTPDVSFNKEGLKVHINKNNVEEFIIGSVEGVNNESDEIELAEFVNKNLESQKLLNRYKETILIAPNVVFPNKYSLKKRSRVIVLYPLIGVAASLLFFFILSNGVEQQEYSPQEIIATNHSIPETDESNDFIANEIQIETENATEDIAPNQIHPLPEVFNDPEQFNDLAIEIKDSSETIPNELDLPIPEELIVVNDSANEPKLDSIMKFDEPSNNELTLNEWANNQIRNKVLNQETEDVSKIKNDEVLNAIAGGLNKVSKQEIAYNNTSREGYTTKGFSIGNFEFSRTKRKKF